MSYLAAVILQLDVLHVLAIDPLYSVDDGNYEGDLLIPWSILTIGTPVHIITECAQSCILHRFMSFTEIVNRLDVLNQIKPTQSDEASEQVEREDCASSREHRDSTR